MENPKGDLVSCSRCGHDTRAKHGVCGRCTGEGFAVSSSPEEEIVLENIEVGEEDLTLAERLYNGPDFSDDDDE
jgi:hypothetical protein